MRGEKGEKNLRERVIGLIFSGSIYPVYTRPIAIYRVIYTGITGPVYIQGPYTRPILGLYNVCSVYIPGVKREVILIANCPNPFHLMQSHEI